MELSRRREMEYCKYCTDRKNAIEKYEEELELEKLVECQKALEREQIAKGMQCTKKDEIKLKEMQKMQIKEKQDIEAKEAEFEDMWHQCLLHNIRLKEEKEKREADRLKREMHERRLAYDEQIASATRKRRDALDIEREEENKRLEKMKTMMEKEYYDAIKRKKEQQDKNKLNYIEGHEMKLSKLKNERLEERKIDQRTIDIALDELRKERHRKMAEIESLQRENKACIEFVKRERIVKESLQMEAERIAQAWKEEREKEIDDKLEALEKEKQLSKEKRATDYRIFLKERDREIEKMRQDRREAMEKVKGIAYRELELKFNDANEELKKQMEYRNYLRRQIRDNRRFMEDETVNMEIKQRPFTKKPITFKDAMKDKMNGSRMSTNPVHPFTRLLPTNGSNKSLYLPLLK